MISAGQARALLEECELVLGRTLGSLRSRLAKSEDTLGALWELVALHSALGLGESVDHEPSEKMPDIEVDMPGANRFWIEATHIRWPERNIANRIGRFTDWIRKELEKKGLQPDAFEVRVDPMHDNEENDVPLENTWAAIRKIRAWREFVRAVTGGAGNTFECTLPSPYKASIKIEMLAKSERGLYSGYLTPDVIRSPADHPVYKALKAKGEQAKGWELGEPVVVFLCSSLSVSLFDSMRPGRPEVDAAVNAALYDTSQWDRISQYNILRDTSGRDFQVRGASRISGVLLVSIENKLGSWRTSHLRYARTSFAINEGARFPLTPSQQRLVEAINLNQIPYGPQWETWPVPSRREWKDSRRIMNRDDPGKRVSIADGGDGSFDLILPVEDLTRLLAGQIVLGDLLEGKFCAGIRERLDKLPPIESAEVLPGNPKMRESAHIKLTFGRPAPSIVQALRDSGPTATGVNQRSSEDNSGGA